MNHKFPYSPLHRNNQDFVSHFSNVRNVVFPFLCVYQCNVIYIYLGCNKLFVVVFFKSATQIKFIVIKCSIFVDAMPLTCIVFLFISKFHVSCIVPHKHALCPTFSLLGSGQPTPYADAASVFDMHL